MWVAPGLSQGFSVFSSAIGARLLLVNYTFQCHGLFLSLSQQSFNKRLLNDQQTRLAVSPPIQHRPVINKTFDTRDFSMPAHWDSHGQTDKGLATTFAKDTNWGGHGHDRIHGDDPIPGVSSTIAMSGDNDDVEVDLTAGQKMLSAMSGSLLTSLLGKSRDIPAFAPTDSWNSYPSRCCPGSFTVAANAVAHHKYTDSCLKFAAVIQHPSTESRSYGLLSRSFLCHQ